MSDRIVIVGGGVAAARLVRVYREAGGDAALTMLAAERHRPYNRPPLSKAFLRGELSAADVFVEPASAYEDLQVDVHLEATATGVDTAGRRITIADGSEIPYDRLVLASGSVPRELGVPGEQLEGVHTYRGLDDAAAVDAAVSSAERALVIGAGFIGMETAASLRRRGLQVTVIEPAESLFSALRHPDVSASLATLYRERGVDVILRDTVCGAPRRRRPARGRCHASRSDDRGAARDRRRRGRARYLVPPRNRDRARPRVCRRRRALPEQQPSCLGDRRPRELPRSGRRSPTPRSALDERHPSRRTARSDARRPSRALRSGRLLLHRALRHEARPSR